MRRRPHDSILFDRIDGVQEQPPWLAFDSDESRYGDNESELDGFSIDLAPDDLAPEPEEPLL